MSIINNIRNTIMNRRSFNSPILLSSSTFSLLLFQFFVSHLKQDCH